jgi:hypothetical protein
MGEAVKYLWVLPLLAQLTALVVMIADRSVRRYPLLFSLLLTLFTVGVGGNILYRVLAPIPYSRFWVAGFVIGWSLTGLALTEVCTRSFESHPHFAKIAHRIIQTVFGVSGLAVLGSLVVGPGAWVRQFYDFFQAQGYLVQGSLATLGFSILLFAWIVGLKLRPDARLVVKVITIFCAGEAILGSGISAAWPSTRVPWPSFAYYVGVGWSTACWATFAWLWARRPVEKETGPRIAMDERSAANLLDQLESTNSRLADVIRRG